jgi:hypothetical protein
MARAWNSSDSCRFGKIWFLFIPAYLYQRRKSGRRNLLIPGIVSVAIFFEAMRLPLSQNSKLATLFFFK